MRHTLYIHRATARQVLEFLTQSQSIIFNCNWPMHSPFEEPATHNVYCELAGVDLATARELLEQAAVRAGSSFEWEIMPDRI